MLLGTAVVFCSEPQKNKNLLEPVYVIQSVYHNSRLDTVKIKNIDSLPVPYPADGSFQIGAMPVIAGPNKVFVFISVEYGNVSYSEKPVPIHSIITAEISKTNQLVRAFHYVLEWQDSPSVKLLVSSAENLVLKPMKAVSAFRFKNHESEPVQVDGILDNVYQGKKVF